MVVENDLKKDEWEVFREQAKERTTLPKKYRDTRIFFPMDF